MTVEVLPVVAPGVAIITGVALSVNGAAEPAVTVTATFTLAGP